MLAGKQAKAMALAVQAARVARADAAMMGMELSPAVLRGRAIVLAIDADGGAWSLELISDDGVQSWVRRPMRAEDIEACECLESK
jgi:KaiC/GvpD/RAD55 family RecA-like ATPase